MKKLFILLFIIPLFIQSQNSYAEQALSFKSPDARQVPVGYYQEIFQPTQFTTTSYSYLPIEKFYNQYQAILPPCTEKSEPCIQSVEFSKDKDNWFSAIPGKDEGQRSYSGGSLVSPGVWQWDLTSTYDFDEKTNRPNGGTVRGWEIPNFPHAGGTTYNVIVELSGGYDKKSNRFGVGQFDFRVVPIIRKSVITREQCDSFSEFQEIGLQNQRNPGLCFTAVDFPSGISVRLTVNLGRYLEQLNGWFDGRLFDPSVRIDNKQGSISITGSPLEVPVVSSKQIRYEDVPKKIKIPGVASQSEQTKSGIGMAHFSVGNAGNALERFITFGDSIQEKIIGIQTIWSLSSISGNNKCVSKNSVNGIVSTNATIYQSSAPTWNKKDSSLNFRVATSHENIDGTPFRGYYSLLLTEKTATCLWGNNFSKGSAKVSVQSQSGNPSVAVTTFGLRNNWANFSASGFTFSAPTIKAKIQNIPVNKN